MGNLRTAVLSYMASSRDWLGATSAASGVPMEIDALTQAGHRGDRRGKGQGDHKGKDDKGKGKGDHKGKNDHKGKSDSKGKNDGKGKRKGENRMCYHCGKNGHLAMDCWNKKWGEGIA